MESVRRVRTTFVGGVVALAAAIVLMPSFDFVAAQAGLQTPAPTFTISTGPDPGGRAVST